MDSTFTEAWLTWAHWARFPFLFVAALAYLLPEELLLGPVVTQQRGAHLAGLGAAPDRVSCARLWDLRPSQRSHPADPPLDIPRALFHLPASRDGSCTQTDRISNGRSRLRCYTPRWFLPGDLPRHLNRLLGRKGPFACKFARRERCGPSSYQKHDRDCNCRWRAIGSDVWRAVGASRPHRYYF